MKQGTMLREATSHANRGERVVVCTHRYDQALRLKKEALKEVTETPCKEGRDFIQFKSGGLLRFIVPTERKLLGFVGRVYRTHSSIRDRFFTADFKETSSFEYFEDWVLDSGYLPIGPSRLERLLKE